jgi:hypothetical protein
MNSERRRKKKEREKRGLWKIMKDKYGSFRKKETEDYDEKSYDTLDGHEEADYEAEQKREEILESEETGYDVEEVRTDDAEEKISKNGLSTNSDNLETYSETGMVNEGVSDEEANAANKFFGFVKGQYDKFTGDYTDKRKAKEEAYQKFLQEKPELMEKYKDALAQKKEDEFKAELEKDLNKKKGSEWINAYTDISHGASKVAGMIPGSHDPNKITNMIGMLGTGMGDTDKFRSLMGYQGMNDPTRMIGMRGSVFGAGPMQQAPMPQQGMYPTQQTRGMQVQMQTRQGMQVPEQARQGMDIERIQQRNLKPQMPEQYMDHNVPGSQVPKYSARPANMDPNAVYARITKIDRYGKKRSYLRRMRVPEVTQPGMPDIPRHGYGSQMPMQERPMPIQYAQESQYQLPQQDFQYRLDNVQDAKPYIPEIGGMQDLHIDERSESGFNPNKFLGFEKHSRVIPGEVVNKNTIGKKLKKGFF